MQKTYRDALEVALANAGGADASTLSGWSENLTEADRALDGAIAQAVRVGREDDAKVLAARGAELRACAAFLDKLYEEMERPRED